MQYLSESKIALLRDAPVMSSIIKMSLPVVMGMMVQVLYNLVDVFFVGMLHDPFQLAAGQPVKKFFNTSGNKYKEMALKDKLPMMSQEEQIALLASDGMLVKRPLLVGNGKILQTCSLIFTRLPIKTGILHHNLLISMPVLYFFMGGFLFQMNFLICCAVSAAENSRYRYIQKRSGTSCRSCGIFI